MYESLRKLIVESEGDGGRDRLANMGLTFQVNLTSPPENTREGNKLSTITSF